MDLNNRKLKIIHPHPFSEMYKTSPKQIHLNHKLDIWIW